MRRVTLTIALALMANAASAAELPASLARMDADKNGKLTVAEFTADRPVLIRKIDKDKNSTVSPAEVAAYYEKAGGAGDPKNADRVAKIMAADADSNGEVSAAELVTWVAADFRKRDKDGDGFITAADRGN